MASTRPDPRDLTARARIRDAAMQHFGELGFDRATIRGIAETAGVSSGLVRHHFGSKQALREACDEHLSRTIRRLNDEARAEIASGSMDYLSSARGALDPHQRYLARSLAEGTAAPLFDEMVRMCEQWLGDLDKGRPDQPDVDLRTRATVVTAMSLGISVLHQHVSRGMGVEMFSPEGDRLVVRALLDIYSHPMLSTEQADMARDALDRS